MISAEEIACRIPGQDAIKLETLYCTLPAGSVDAAGTASAVADLAMVVLTVVLAIFAFRAWRTAVETLAAMKKESDRQYKALQLQLSKQDELNSKEFEQSRELNRELVQLAAYERFIRDLGFLVTKCTNQQVDVQEAITNASLSWQVWAMPLASDHRELHQLSQEFVSEASFIAKVLNESSKPENLYAGAATQIKEAREHLIGFFGSWTAILGEWMIADGSTDKNLEKLRANKQAFKESFAQFERFRPATT